MTGDVTCGAPSRLSLGPIAVRILVRPHLWLTAIRQAIRFAPAHWWRNSPPLPLPAPEILLLRSQIAYGGDGWRMPSPEDVTAYLDWCRQMNRYMRRGVARSL